MFQRKIRSFRNQIKVRSIIFCGNELKKRNFSRWIMLCNPCLTAKARLKFYTRQRKIMEWVSNNIVLWSNCFADEVQFFVFQEYFFDQQSAYCISIVLELSMSNLVCISLVLLFGIIWMKNWQVYPSLPLSKLWLNIILREFFHFFVPNKLNTKLVLSLTGTV